MPVKARYSPPSPQPEFGWFDEVSGKTPDYFSRRAAGEHLFAQPYVFNNTQAKARVVPIPGSIHSYSVLDEKGSYPWINRWVFGLLPGIDSSDNLKVKMVQRLETALRTKIQEQSAALPVSILEAKSTMALVSGVVRDIATSFRALVRGQPTEAINVLLYGSRQGYRDKNVPRSLADRWLEWSYGVKPLIADVQGSALGLAKIDSHEGNRLVHVTAREKEFVSRRARIPVQPSQNQKFFDHSGRGALIGRGDVWMKTSSLTNQALDDFGFSDFAGTVWEVIPYSFVVDWFVPIGSWLGSMRPINNFTFYDGCLYLKVTNGIVILKAGVLGRFQSLGSARSVYKERIRMTTWPTFTLPIPDWDLLASQVVSGFSLLMSGLDLGRRS